MFCKNCGTQLPDGTAFCPNCGTPAGTSEATLPNESPSYDPAPVQPAAPVQPVAPTQPVAPVPPVSYDPAPSAFEEPKRKKSPLKPILIIVSCLLVLAIAGGVLFQVFVNNREAVAKKYAKAYLEGDINAMLSCSLLDKKASEKAIKDEAKDEDMTVKEYYEEMGDRYDAKIKNFNDLVKAESKAIKKEMKEKYGKYTVSVKVKDSEKLDKDELKQLKDRLKEESYKKYITVSKISAAYEYKLKIKINGKEKDDEFTWTVTVVKYGLFWKGSPISLYIIKDDDESEVATREYDEDLDGEYVEEAEPYVEDDDYDYGYGYDDDEDDYDYGYDDDDDDDYDYDDDDYDYYY